MSRHPTDRTPSNPLHHVDLRVRAMRVAFRTVGHLAPGTAARVAEEIFCRPPRHAVREREERFLATGERFEVESAGWRLAGWSWGSGPAVVLVHGWGSRAGRFAALVPALVGAGFRAVAYDGPAHGQSTGHRASLPEFALALRAVAAAQGPFVAAVGHSLGGAAICVAHAHGLPLARAALLAAPADPGEFAGRFGRHLRIPRAVEARMRANLEARFRMRWSDFHIPSLVARFGIPALVIHDHEDHDVPLADGRALAGAWPGAQFVATSGLGHRSIVRDAGVIARVAAFLGDR